MKTHDRTLAIIFTALAAISFSAVQAQWTKPDSDTLRILLVGNSFSQNATRYLGRMASDGGYTLVLGHAELPACPVERHWNRAMISERYPDSLAGRPYKGRSLSRMLESEKWDFITMQQYSMHSSDYGTYMPWADSLYNYMKELCPGAKIVWHQTWAYRNDARIFGQMGTDATTGKPVRAKTDRQMWEGITSSTEKLTAALPVDVIPVGEAFWHIRCGRKTAYSKDTAFDFKNPDYPALPVQDNSLNVGYYWNRDKKFILDPNHANQAGCYLGGLVWYSFFFGENPQTVKYLPEGVSPKFASELKKTASKVFKEHKRQYEHK